jgi:hypothetical protein
MRFADITLCIASERVFIVAGIYFVPTTVNNYNSTKFHGDPRISNDNTKTDLKEVIC